MRDLVRIHTHNFPTQRRIMSELSDKGAGVQRSQYSNRLFPIMQHIPYYAYYGKRHLALDCGVSPSTISRLVRGVSVPSFQLSERVVSVLQKRLGLPLTAREVFSPDGTYPTPCVCDLTGDCGGCHHPDALNADGTTKYEYRDHQKGDWCRYPPMVES